MSLLKDEKYWGSRVLLFTTLTLPLGKVGDIAQLKKLYLAADSLFHADLKLNEGQFAEARNLAKKGISYLDHETAERITNKLAFGILHRVERDWN